MRLFVAVVPPSERLDDLERFIQRVRSDVPGEDAGIRWAGRDQWHVTLAFLGEVPEPRLDGLQAGLGRAVSRHPPFALQLQEADRFADRVLWVGVGGGRTALNSLARSVQAAARQSGVPVASRGYHPHLTVGRTHESVDLRPWADRLEAWQGVAWQVHEVELIRSHLGPRTTYETLTTFPLT